MNTRQVGLSTKDDVYTGPGPLPFVLWFGILAILGAFAGFALF